MSPAADIATYALDAGVATITLCRPDRRNALSEPLVDALVELLVRARRDDDARVVVLTGAGDRAFCAGGDLSGMTPGSPLQRHFRRGAYVELIEAIRGLGKPSIARVNGHALGGGLGLVMACDLAVAVEGASLGTPEISVGLFPMMIMALLVRHVGRKRALEMMLTGARISARQARDMGIVNRVVPPAELDQAIGEYTAQLLRLSPAILRLGLESFEAMSDLPLGPALRLLQAQLSVNTMAEDAAVGVAAFLSKNPEPEWKGR